MKGGKFIGDKDATAELCKPPLKLDYPNAEPPFIFSAS